MKIVLDGCGNRGYRHAVTHVDLGLQRNYTTHTVNPFDLTGPCDFMGPTEPDDRGHVAKTSVERDDRGNAVGLSLRTLVSLRTNGDYMMRVELTERDILFMAWVLLRDRSFGWISDSFAQVKRLVTERPGAKQAV